MKFSECFLTLFLLIICSFSASAEDAQRVFPKRDLQGWTETWVTFPKFYNPISYGYLNFTRVGQDISTNVDERHGAFVGYKLYPEFSITITGLHIDQNPVPSISREQDRFLLDANGTIEILDKLNFTYRARYESQFRYSQGDNTELRPRIGIELPNIFGEAPVKPFLNFEGFHRSAGDEWYRLRSLVGFNYMLDSTVNLDFYYGNQINRDPSTSDLDILGCVVRISLPNF